MTQIGQATLQIIPSLRGVSSKISGELAGVGADAGGKASKGFGRRFVSGIGGLVKTAGKTGLAVGGAFATAAGTLGFARMMGLEEAAASLDAMGISAGDADRLMDALNDTLTGTPYALNDGATAMAGFVSSGLELDKIPKALDLVADAAAFGKADLGEVSDIFQKVVLNGGATTQMLRELQFRGIPAFALLQDAAGMTGEEFSKFVADSKLDADTFFELWEQGADGFGDANIKMAGAAQNAGEVVRGAWGNTKAAVARIGATFLQPIYDALPGALTAITGHLNTIRDHVGEAVEGFIDSGAIEATWDIISARARMFGDVLAGIDWSRIDLGAIGARIADTLGAVGDALAPLAPKIADAATAIGEQIAPTLEHLADAAQTVAPWLADVAAGIGEHIAGAVETLAPALPTIASFAGTLVDLVTKIPASTVAALGAALAGIFAAKAGVGATVAAYGKVAGHIGRIRASASTAATSVSKLWNASATKSGYSGIDRLRLAAMGARDRMAGLASAAGRFAGAAKNAAGAALGWAQATLRSAAASARAALASAAGAAKQALLTAAQKVAAGVQWALNAAMNANPIAIIVIALVALVAAVVTAYQKVDWFRDIVDAIGRVIADVAGAIWDGLVVAFDWLVGVLETVAEAFSTVFDFITGAVAAVVEWVTDHWQLLLAILTGPIGLAAAFIAEHWETIKSTISGAVSAVTSTLSGAWDAISGTVSTIWSGISGTVSGAWSTITGSVSTATETVKRVMSNAWTSARETLRNFISRIMGTFRALPGNIGRAIRNLVSALSAPFKRAGNAIAAAWNATIGGFSITIPDIIGLPGRGQTFQIPRMPTFHRGGIVGAPGITGDEAVAKVLRGEWILRPDQVARLAGGAPTTSTAGPVAVSLHFHGPVTTDGARWVADQTRQAIRAGYMRRPA